FRQALTERGYESLQGLGRAAVEEPDHGHRWLLRAHSERPCHSQSSNSFNEGASSHCRPQGSGPVRTMLWTDAITAGICDRWNGVRPSFCAATILRTECPLGSKADIGVRPRVVRFTPESGH